jgi:hypothetical protein
MTLRIMFDLETMSTAANAAITQIGACANDGREPFKATVTLHSSMSAGLKVDGSTIMWWMQQSDEARASICDASQPLREALIAFSSWLGYQGKPVECELWAYPAQFDVTILGEAYRALAMTQPWHYRAPRCLRTAVALAPGVEKPTDVGVKHDALVDAQYQMAWLDVVLKVLNVP